MYCVQRINGTEHGIKHHYQEHNHSSIPLLLRRLHIREQLVVEYQDKKRMPLHLILDIIKRR